MGANCAAAIRTAELRRLVLLTKIDELDDFLVVANELIEHSGRDPLSDWNNVSLISEHPKYLIANARVCQGG